MEIPDDAREAQELANRRRDKKKSEPAAQTALRFLNQAQRDAPVSNIKPIQLSADEKRVARAMGISESMVIAGKAVEQTNQRIAAGTGSISADERRIGRLMGLSDAQIIAARGFPTGGDAA
ncbi:MAG TPA: hypothetical protein VGI10_12525 [Polyangiaceae bacterium]